MAEQEGIRESNLDSPIRPAEKREEQSGPASTAPIEPHWRPFDEVQHDLEHLEGRDVQLWSIALLVALAMAGGMCGLLLPKVIWHRSELHTDSPYFSQLFFGFVALIVLFNAYVWQQRRLLGKLRTELTRQLMRANAAESVAQIDPLTETLNRRLMAAMLQREIRRTNRLRGTLTVMMIDVDDFKSVNTLFGHIMGDRVLQDVARLLKKTFRASDTLFRYGGDEFLVIMADTASSQAQIVVDRLHQNVDRWNQKVGIPGWKLALSCGCYSYKSGMTMEELIESADQRMYADKDEHRTVTAASSTRLAAASV
ncbi:MAG: GGDEF domain-containing protein [Acidobacteria bacterium]|nr:GGDEF domain-containing protein [Acidobacteriota bacterium]